MAPLFIGKSAREAAKMLLLQTCGTAPKIGGSYQENSLFFSVTKH